MMHLLRRHATRLLLLLVGIGPVRSSRASRSYVSSSSGFEDTQLDGPAYDAVAKCPQTTLFARLNAAEKAGGNPLRLFRIGADSRVHMWYKAAKTRPFNPATDEKLHRKTIFHPSADNKMTIMALGTSLPAIQGTGGGNRTLFFNNVAWSNCWEPVPMHYGPMIWKWSEVVPAMTDPEQKRGYYTATAEQDPDFFGKDVLIFLDGKRHRAMRDMLEDLEFARTIPIDLKLVRDIPDRLDGKNISVVVASVIPVLVNSLLGKPPSSEAFPDFLTYVEKCALMIFGSTINKAILKRAGTTQLIMDSRKKMAKWSATTPWMMKLLEAQKKLPAEWRTTTLVEDFMSVVGFAGLFGTATMINNCVKYQERDSAHKTMFEKDPARYLIELMRVDSSVTSVTDVLRKNTEFNLEGRKMILAPGTPRQLVLSTANRDPKHWHKPNVFDPNREDLGDTLGWNGKARDVEARDLDKAPRHCPGYCLSIKAGAAVCAKLMGSFERLEKEGKLGTDIQCTVFGNHGEDSSKGSASYGSTRPKPAHALGRNYSDAPSPAGPSSGSGRSSRSGRPRGGSRPPRGRSSRPRG